MRGGGKGARGLWEYSVVTFFLFSLLFHSLKEF